MSEFDLIERIRRRSRADDSVVIGIGDDAAVVQPEAGFELVVTTDSLVVDRHFTDHWAPADIGHVAAQANLSDLAAMGARPHWALLSLTLPEDDPAWLDGFLDGFLAAAEEHGVCLVGGNLARGPLNVGVELIGQVKAGDAVTRTGGQPGDRLVVTGTIGDAAAALALGNAAPAELAAGLHRPRARVQAGRVLAGHARAMIDLSDGLLADLGHLLAGGLGAEVRLDRLPASKALVTAIGDRAQRWRLQCAGGSDYELLAILPSEADEDLEALAAAAGVAITQIGCINDHGRIDCRAAGDEVPDDLGYGWDHFPHE